MHSASSVPCTPAGTRNSTANVSAFTVAWKTQKTRRAVHFALRVTKTTLPVFDHECLACVPARTPYSCSNPTTNRTLACWCFRFHRTPSSSRRPQAVSIRKKATALAFKRHRYTRPSFALVPLSATYANRVPPAELLRFCVGSCSTATEVKADLHCPRVVRLRRRKGPFPGRFRCEPLEIGARAAHDSIGIEH